jgi:hypothetical protein
MTAKGIAAVNKQDDPEEEDPASIEETIRRALKMEGADLDFRIAVAESDGTVFELLDSLPSDEFRYAFKKALLSHSNYSEAQQSHIVMRATDEELKQLITFWKNLRDPENDRKARELFTKILSRHVLE